MAKSKREKGQTMTDKGKHKNYRLSNTSPTNTGIELRCTLRVSSYSLKGETLTDDGHHNNDGRKVIAIAQTMLL
jgi:hypothetical protein